MDTTVPPSTLSGSQYFTPTYGDGGTYIDGMAEFYQVLNRVGYGPTSASLAKIETMGTEAYLTEQLNPDTIDESGNDQLNDAIDALFFDFLPFSGDELLSQGAAITYFKGLSEPPADWMTSGFDDATWLTGVTGIGYADGDDATELTDMRGNYSTVYVRADFDVPDVNDVDTFLLNIIFDDGFVAYLNGTEVARHNITGTPPPYTAETGSSGGFENGDPSTFDLTSVKNLLTNGTNTLAVQLINASIGGSSDSSLIPVLVSAPAPAYQAIRSIKDLQHLLHLRGIYSEKQLQTTLAAFWENHFTTDYDKVQDYIEDLDEFDALPDGGRAQSRIEAASIEYEEYQFYYDNALGNFGDMLLYSATSPSMLIYLDNILNRKNAPNENYSREIMELSAFGVDNRYTQADIEELARCFTGWSVRKIHPSLRKPFPDSARDPFLTGSIAVGASTPILAEGETWKYFKGISEPSGGAASIDWTLAGYDDSAWLSGPSGFGYSDADDNTQLSDMEDLYRAVYLRKEFTVDTSAHDQIVLSLKYDDGYVAYLNGVEIDRSNSMNNAPTPPPFDRDTDYGHENNGDNPDIIDITNHPALVNGTNIFAVQGHNTSISSSDFSIIPEVLGRSLTADSINPADPDGVWTFWFNPDQHDYTEKILFPGTVFETIVPEALPGNEHLGMNDAIDIIDDMVSHPSTSEFLCIKLVNKFVSDEISLDTYHARTAPAWLLAIVDDAIAAWNSTSPAGNIKTVMTSILDPQAKVGGFWLEGAHLSKIKDPLEFINSGFRALGADITSSNLPDRDDDMGMLMFQRNDPDGFSEKGIDWSDTLGLLERMKFSQALSDSSSFSRGTWDIDSFLTNFTLLTPDDVIDHFDDVLFNQKLGAVRRAVFIEFANTDDTGAASPFSGLSANQQRNRLRDLTGLILSAPEFQFQ